MLRLICARLTARVLPAAAAAALALGLQAATATASPSWPLPNLDLASTRALPASGISRSDVARLHVVWRLRLPALAGSSGAFTGTPVVDHGVVYVQDMSSTVFALAAATGKELWRHRFVYGSDPGPNGLAVAGGRVFGSTPTDAFALAAATGRLLWSRQLVTLGDPVIDIAPQVANGIVYTSTIGLPPFGKGRLYALRASSGAILWQRSTIKGSWAIPRQAGGGGAWYPPSVADGEVYWGIANPYPYGGSRAEPNGAAYAGTALYTDSLMVVGAGSGQLAWFDQVTPHDVRDYDFQLSPILTSVNGAPLVIGAGKGGVVIAWNRTTHRRVWQARVGVHDNDHGPLPARRISVCPGLLGGVETPMALAAGRLFVPVVDLCSQGGAYGYEPLADLDVAAGRGELISLAAATGTRLWSRRLPQPDLGCATVADGVVFTSTLGGRLYGLDARTGRTLWTAELAAGINSCPALAGDLLLVGAGLRLARGETPELEAFAP